MELSHVLDCMRSPKHELSYIPTLLELYVQYFPDARRDRERRIEG